MSELEIRESLPVFPTPPPPERIEDWRIGIGGLVEPERELSLTELEALGTVDLRADFSCEEGWQVPGLRWSGVPLARLIDLATVSPDARYVAVGSGQFVTVLPLSSIQDGQPLLANRLDGQPLPWEHGGPLRLVIEDGICYQGVKWVDRIVLTADSSAETARDIALGRIASKRQAEEKA